MIRVAQSRRHPDPYLIPLLGIGLMVLVVVLAMVSGYWATTGRQVAGGEAGGGRGTLSPGGLTPDGLKGWMTIEEACTGLGCSVADFLAVQGLPATTSPETMLRELESMGTTMTVVREKAAELLARPR